MKVTQHNIYLFVFPIFTQRDFTVQCLLSRYSHFHPGSLYCTMFTYLSFPFFIQEAFTVQCLLICHSHFSSRKPLLYNVYFLLFPLSPRSLCSIMFTSLLFPLSPRKPLGLLHNIYLFLSFTFTLSLFQLQIQIRVFFQIIFLHF